jgi:hypothetical protein
MLDYIMELIKQYNSTNKPVVKFSKPSGYKNINHFTIPPKH